MSEDDVDRAIIKPMTTMYPAPRHLRIDEDAHYAMLAAYRKALASFEEPVLKQAWDQAVQENGLWCWPKLADLVRLAGHFHRQAHPPQEADALVEKAVAMADAYTRRFMKTSAHAARAREGGYEAELREYVKEAAYVQAQYLLGREGVGYSSGVLFAAGQGSDERAMFFARAREQAGRGHIRVQMPPEVVGPWQRAAAGQGQAR